MTDSAGSAELRSFARAEQSCCLARPASELFSCRSGLPSQVRRWAHVWRNPGHGGTGIFMRRWRSPHSSPFWAVLSGGSSAINCLNRALPPRRLVPPALAVEADIFADTTAAIGRTLCQVSKQKAPLRDSCSARTGLEMADTLRKAAITESVRVGDLPRLVVFVSRDLTTGRTMRNLRVAQQLWASAL